MFSNERPRGFGFVCFSTVKEAMTALQRMHGYWMGHKPLYVNVAQSFEERRRYLRRLKSMEFSMRAVYPPNGYYFPQTLPSFPTSASDMRYMGMSVPVPAMVPPSTIPFDRHYEMVSIDEHILENLKWRFFRSRDLGRKIKKQALHEKEK